MLKLISSMGAALFISQHVYAQQLCSNCPTEYSPVCVDSRITFANQCQAECRGYSAANFIIGECIAPKCVCQQKFAPVCANGRQYGNECNARCAGVTVFSPGACKEQKVCSCPATDNYEPVCSGGLIYASSCIAKCHGITDFKNGTDCVEADGNPDSKLPGNGSGDNGDNGGVHLQDISSSERAPAAASDKIDCSKCPPIYDPVCADGVSYYSSCLAKCNGKSKWSANECGGCACNLPKDPVCSDDVTFETPCEARCAGKSAFTRGQCV